MAALLGMIALAGYQNRDKLIAMYNSATSGADAAPEHEKQASLIHGLTLEKTSLSSQLNLNRRSASTQSTSWPPKQD